MADSQPLGGLMHAIALPQFTPAGPALHSDLMPNCTTLIDN